MKNTLLGFIPKEGRAVGNSTRQVDLAIQILFEDKEVHILDHCEQGQSKKANADLRNRIMLRLNAEHLVNLIGFTIACDDIASVITLKKASL